MKSDLRERESTLMTVANQAALALGTTILCIDRARRLAVETERNRIARDIHDTVVQSLFGVVYSLDACINMLPARAEEVRNELIELRSLATSAHDEVRRSIFDLWPSALDHRAVHGRSFELRQQLLPYNPFSIILAIAAISTLYPQGCAGPFTAWRKRPWPIPPGIQVQTLPVCA
jgi:signal transduction histidine kinase